MSDDADRTNPHIVLADLTSSEESSPTAPSGARSPQSRLAPASSPQPLLQPTSPGASRAALPPAAAPDAEKPPTRPSSPSRAKVNSAGAPPGARAEGLLQPTHPGAAAPAGAAPTAPPPAPSPGMPSSISIDFGTFGPGELKPDYLPPGINLRGWVIETKIGAGGMGAVYRVRDDSEVPPLTAALKMSLPPAEVESPEAKTDRIRRFEREAGVILGLDHPNILKPFSYFTWQGHPCLVMPFVEGDTLKTYCHQAKPSLRDILQKLLLPVAKALTYIHNKGIFHRDIKAANIMVVRADGRPLLMDFGIARSGAAATLTQGQLLATLEMCCPEYFLHFGSAHAYDDARFDYTPASDVFCLGATFFDLLTGALPYLHVVGADGNYLSPAFQQKLATYEPLPASSLNASLPAAVDPLFLAMMQASPSQRLTTGAQVAAHIEALLAAHPAPHPQFDSPFVLPPRRRTGDTPTRPKPAAAKPPPAPAPTFQPPVPAPSGSFTPPPLAPESAAAIPGEPQQSASVHVAAAPVPGGPSLLAAPGLAQPSGDFKPPTVAARAQAFSPPLAAPGASQPPPPQEPGLNTQLRNASAFLSGPGTPASQGTKPAFLIVGGLGLAVLLIVGLAFVSAQSAGPAQPQPTSLLDAPTQPSAAAPAPPSPEPLSPPPPAAVADEPEPALEPLVLTPPATPSKGSIRKGASTDQRAVDALLAQEYGGQRPTLDNTGAPPAPSQPARPSWLRVSNAVTQPNPGAGPRTFGVPLGTEMAARLAKPLDSRTIGSGPVIVKLARPLVVRGSAIFPSGSMAYGVASANGGRFDVRFSRLKLPDGTEVPFEGIAYDNEDKKPGLRPSSRVQQGPGRSTGVGEAVLKGTANALLGKAGGNDAVDIARGAGQTIVNHDGTQPAGGAQEALLLDAPADFTIFVSAAF